MDDEVEDIDEELEESMETPPPLVLPTELCICHNTDGTQCLKPTGNTEVGVDVDLCPEHRKMMAEQRQQYAES